MKFLSLYVAPERVRRKAVSRSALAVFMRCSAASRKRGGKRSGWFCAANRRRRRCSSVCFKPGFRSSSSRIASGDWQAMRAEITASVSPVRGGAPSCSSSSDRKKGFSGGMAPVSGAPRSAENMVEAKRACGARKLSVSAQSSSICFRTVAKSGASDTLSHRLSLDQVTGEEKAVASVRVSTEGGIGFWKTGISG